MPQGKKSRTIPNSKAIYPRTPGTKPGLDMDDKIAYDRSTKNSIMMGEPGWDKKLESAIRRAVDPESEDALGPRSDYLNRARKKAFTSYNAEGEKADQHLADINHARALAAAKRRRKG